jgi:CBS domain-containing protein
MTVARDVMTESPVCINGDESVYVAAGRMRELNVGALPICGEDNRLHGMITDRDIVVEVFAKRFDPYKINVAQLAQGRAVTVDAETDVDDVVATMIEHKIRRLPVLDDRQLVGLIAAGDIARTVPHERAGELLEALSLS